jgi:hypothetical protein
MSIPNIVNKYVHYGNIEENNSTGHKLIKCNRPINEYGSHMCDYCNTRVLYNLYYNCNIYDYDIRYVCIIKNFHISQLAKKNKSNR